MCDRQVYFKPQIPEIQAALKDFFCLISEIDTNGLTLKQKIYFFSGISVISVGQLGGLPLRTYGRTW